MLLLVAQHTRTENPYQLLYRILGIGEPGEPRTKPTCCDPKGQPPAFSPQARNGPGALTCRNRSMRRTPTVLRTAPL